MSTVACELPVTPIGPIIREADARVKDKSYRRCPIGAEFARYLRACRWADLAENTLLALETVGARFAIDHDDIKSLDYFCSPVGQELIEDFLVRHWGDSAKRTKHQRQKLLHGWFKWAAAQRRIPYDPTAALRLPRSGGEKARQPYPPGIIARLLAQPVLRDETALELTYELALRANDIRMLMIRDIDLARDIVWLLHRKGGVQERKPIETPGLRDKLYLHIQGDNRQPDEYLIYGRERRTQPLSRQGVNDWFKRCLANAGLPSTIMLHELRHTSLDEMHRSTGDIVQAKQLAGHKSVGTTEAYLHPLEDDLRAGMRARAAARELSSSPDAEGQV